MCITNYQKVFAIASPRKTHVRLHVIMASNIGISKNSGDMLKIAELMRGWINLQPVGTAIITSYTD